MVIIYTTKMSGWLVWLTASLALVGLHVASVLVGSLTQYFLSAFVLSIICAILFFLFGIALIYQGCQGGDSKFEEELEEVREELLTKDERGEALIGDYNRLYDEENKIEEKRRLASQNSFKNVVALFMTVVIAEMGDRSQISAIGLAAKYNLFSIIVGGSVGHLTANFMAVVAGHFIGK